MGESYYLAMDVISLKWRCVVKSLKVIVLNKSLFRVLLFRMFIKYICLIYGPTDENLNNRQKASLCSPLVNMDLATAENVA